MGANGWVSACGGVGVEAGGLGLGVWRGTWPAWSKPGMGGGQR